MTAMVAFLDFPTGTILAIFDLQVTPILPACFQVNCLSVKKKKLKLDFKDGSHLVFQIRKISAIFDVQVTPMLPTKFQVNWPFCSGEDIKYRFSRWRPSWISDRNNFSYF